MPFSSVGQQRMPVKHDVLGSSPRGAAIEQTVTAQLEDAGACSGADLQPF